MWFKFKWLIFKLVSPTDKEIFCTVGNSRLEISLIDLQSQYAIYTINTSDKSYWDGITLFSVVMMHLGCINHYFVTW